MNLFKMDNWKRIVILVVTTVAAILSIILGSIFYIGQPGNIKKSIEYGGGVQYVVKIENDKGSYTSAKDIAHSIQQRIDAAGVGGANVVTGTSGTHSTITVEYPGLSTTAERDAMQKTIIEKPRLVLTDLYGNPLFDENGKFNKLLNANTKTFVGTPSYTYRNPADFYLNKDPNGKRYVRSNVPLKNNGAQAFMDRGNSKVRLEFTDSRQWYAATEYISKLTGRNQIVAWLDPDIYIRKLVSLRGMAIGNPVPKWTGDMFGNAHVDIKNNPKKLWKVPSRNFDASDYVISSASVKTALGGGASVLEGEFSRDEALQVANKLNFGSAKYHLKLLSKSMIDATYGSDSFKKAMIAGVVVFSIIAIFLIVNYGLLGALSTISISLYLFMTLLMFTIMRGEYSPETIAALIIGLGMSVDANIITFERLKSEVYSGSNLRKGHKNANKRSLSSIFDANITTLIVAFVLFYFGTKAIVGLSVTLIISIFFTLVIMLGFTRVLSTTLVNTDYFENKKHLLGIRPNFDQKVQAILEKPNYIKSSKIFSILSLAIIVASIVIFATIAGIAGSISNGVVLSKSFTGGSNIVIQKGFDTQSLSSISLADFNNLKTEVINKTNIPASAIIFKNGTLVIDSTKDFSNDIQSWLNASDTLILNGQSYHVSVNVISTEMAQELVTNSIYAISIAMGLVVVYTLVRFRWTYSLSAIIALIHDGLMVVALFVITRVEISPVFVAGLLSVLGYSINDTIVTFDRVRERMNNHSGELTQEKIKSIGNNAIKDTIKRSLLTSITTVTAIAVLMSFGNATKLAFNLSMLIGLVAGTYSSIFIATFIWVKLEVIRQKGINRRERKGFWKTRGIEEQTFTGINDFKA